MQEIALGINLIDISNKIGQLVKRKPFLRDISAIDTIFIHHSGRSGAKGDVGAVNSARYFLRKFNMPPYHFWVPEKLVDNKVVIYQMAPINWRCYHTGGLANGRGIGVVLQGNKTKSKLTYNQQEALEALLPYLQNNFNITAVLPHSRGAERGGRSKKKCPGFWTEKWLVK